MEAPGHVPSVPSPKSGTDFALVLGIPFIGSGFS